MRGGIRDCKNLPPRVCRWCKKVFKPSFYTEFLCSDDCKFESHSEAKKRFRKRINLLKAQGKYQPKLSIKHIRAVRRKMTQKAISRAIAFMKKAKRDEERKKRVKIKVCYERPLLFTSPSLDELKKLVLRKLNWSEVDLKPATPTQWDVYNSSGKTNEYKVTFKQRRYRFEEIWN